MDGPSSDGPLRDRTAAECLSKQKYVDSGGRGGDRGGGERCGMAANDTLTQVQLVAELNGCEIKHVMAAH